MSDAVTHLFGQSKLDRSDELVDNVYPIWGICRSGQDHRRREQPGRRKGSGDRGFSDGLKTDPFIAEEHVQGTFHVAFRTEQHCLGLRGGFRRWHKDAPSDRRYFGPREPQVARSDGLGGDPTYASAAPYATAASER
jgi:hypothetical protein